MTAFNPTAATESKQYAYDPQSAPPPFGHALLPYFAFSSSYTNLNHGSYGSLPLPVQSQVDALGAEAETNPDLWHRLTYYPRLTVAREQIARLIGAKVEECVIVGNASTGINVVLRNFAWNDGDVLVGATTTYGSIDKTLLYLHDVHPKTVLRPFTLHFPTSHADIIENWRKHLRSLPRATPSESNPKPKTVAVIDSIVSNPGALLPWKEMVKICKEEGVWSVIDAAHSIGQEVGVNLAEAQPDFWISNCHKWLYAKRGCAVLYVPERNRHIIKTSFPTSHFYKKEPTVEDWLHQFDWNGTIDFVPFLSVTPALAFRAWLGGEEVINTYCHDLALRGGAALAKVLDTSMMGNAEEITLNMVNVELPLPHDSFDKFAIINKTLMETMLRKQGVYAAHYYHDGKWWTRASAQVWNEVSDFEKLGHAFVEVCQQIREQLSVQQG